MKTLSLKTLLSAQSDLGAKTVDAVTDAIMDNSYNYTADPITDVIVNAFTNNENGTDLEGIHADISYAIKQLSQVQALVSKTIG